MTPPVTAPGRLVAGRYRLQSRIGGGGMGTVWLARDERLGRQVAVKQVVPPPGADDAAIDQQRQRALREGRIAARLSHPHAIAVYDVALEGGQPWLVMEYLPSRSLATVLAEDGVLRVDQAAQIGAQVADALAATHAAGIVHRDVKPANVLIGSGDRVEGPANEGVVKITDFGISHARDDVTLTRTGQITGTPAFLAPEVARGQEMTEASDVFSLGATLYTCLEGEPPFGMEDNALAMLHRVAGGEIRPPRRSGPMAGPLLAMLAAEPAARPTMAQVRDELAALAAGRSGDATTVLMARTDLRPAGDGGTRTFPPAVAGAPAGGWAPSADDAPVPEQEEPRRSGWLWLAVGAVLALVAGLGILWAVAATDDAGGQARDGGASATASAPSPTTPGQTTPEQTTPEQTTEPTQQTEPDPPAPPPGDAEVRARDVEKAVRDFFKELPDDAEDAYELTSPGFRDRFSLAEFTGFWSQYEEVELRETRAEDGSLTAVARIEFRRPDGSRQTERHLITFVLDEDEDDLLLESDEFQEVVG